MATPVQPLPGEMLLTEGLCPPKIHVKALTPNAMVLEWGGLLGGT